MRKKERLRKDVHVSYAASSTLHTVDMIIGLQFDAEIYFTFADVSSFTSNKGVGGGGGKHENASVGE